MTSGCAMSTQDAPYGSHSVLPDRYASAVRWAMHVILPCGRVCGVAYCGVLGVLRQGSLGGSLQLAVQLQGMGTLVDINSAPYPVWDDFDLSCEDGSRPMQWLLVVLYASPVALGVEPYVALGSCWLCVPGAPRA